jgi:hypothetical protein
VADFRKSRRFMETLPNELAEGNSARVVPRLGNAGCLS